MMRQNTNPSKPVRAIQFIDRLNGKEIHYQAHLDMSKNISTIPFTFYTKQLRSFPHSINKGSRNYVLIPIRLQWSETFTLETEINFIIVNTNEPITISYDHIINSVTTSLRTLFKPPETIKQQCHTLAVRILLTQCTYSVLIPNEPRLCQTMSPNSFDPARARVASLQYHQVTHNRSTEYSMLNSIVECHPRYQQSALIQYKHIPTFFTPPMISHTPTALLLMGPPCTL